MDHPEIVIAIIAACVFVGGTVAVNYWQRRSTTRVWKGAADKLGLKVRDAGSGMVMSGTLRGRDVFVDTVVRREADHARTYVRFCTRLVPKLGVGLHITRQQTLDLSLMLGAQDVKVGEAEFDQRFLIKARDEAGALRLLTPPVRNALRSYDTVLPLNLTDDNICYEQREEGVSVDRIQTVLTWQVRTADILARALAEQVVGDEVC